MNGGKGSQPPGLEDNHSKFDGLVFSQLRTFALTGEFCFFPFRTGLGAPTSGKPPDLCKATAIAVFPGLVVCAQ